MLQLALRIVYIAAGVFAAGWIGKFKSLDYFVIFIFQGVSLLCAQVISHNIFHFTEVTCWILTGERQTAVIRSNYVQVLLNQDMSFFDTYGNNGDIVSQVLSDVLLIQSALSEKVLVIVYIFMN